MKAIEVKARSGGKTDAARRKFNAPFEAWTRRAVSRAKAYLKPGMRVTRKICGGATGTFIFNGWDGEWAQGKTISDCHPLHITKVDGNRVDFTNGDPMPPFMKPNGDVLR